jgi:fatty acid-binding protein 3
LTATEGVEFDEETLDGRKVRSLITPEGAAKLVHVQKDSKTGAVTSTIVREIIGEQLVQTLTAGSVTCKRIYKRTA